MKDSIKRYFERYVHFSDEEMDKILAKLTPKSYPKKSFLLKEGQVCQSKYFIVSGLVRSYFINEKGIEKTTLFGLENWWVTNTESYLKETPSYSYIQALEDSVVLVLEKQELEKLYASIPKLERLFRIVSENMLVAIQRKNDVYLQMKSIDRYSDLVHHFPDFSQRVPQYMIASYLEITPEYLSEIRKKQPR